MLEPIDEVKAQVCRNTDAMSRLQATIEEIKEDSKQTATEIAEIACIIKDLKQHLKTRSTTTRSTIHGLKKFLGKSKSVFQH